MFIGGAISDHGGELRCPMNNELFGDRRHALEEEFFKRQNDELLAAMRGRLESQQLSEALGGATGITDEHVIARLAEAGMSGATVMALALIPLVAVAWADGKLDEPERLRILREPQTAELSEEARALLQNWLIEEPPPSLFQTWLEYIRALRTGMDSAGWQSLKDATSARSRAVAAAAGGEPYGVGRSVSGEEQAVLNRIESAFDD